MDISSLRRGADALTDSADVIAPALLRNLVARDPGWRVLSRASVDEDLATLAAALSARATHGAYPPAVVRRLGDLARKHRTLGPGPAEHRVFMSCLVAAMRETLSDGPAIESARAGFAEAAAIMAAAPDDGARPDTWPARVLEVQRRSREVAVIRLHTPDPVPYRPGQHVAVNPLMMPGTWRRLWPSVPSNREGLLEFHVRVHPSDPMTRPLVATTRQGDEWAISDPRGTLGDFDPTDGTDLLMVAGGTGVAPLRALIYSHAELPEPPRTHLVFGARSPGELHDLRTLTDLAQTLPHLTVTTAVEKRDDDPYTQATPFSEHPRAPLPWLGTAADVAARMVDPGHRRILIGGGPEMIRATREVLLAAGASESQIRHDPLG